MHGGSTEDGAIWNCGFGDEGRLGHGNEQDRLRPTRLGPEVFGGLPVSCLTWRWSAAEKTTASSATATGQASTCLRGWARGTLGSQHRHGGLRDARTL